MSAQLILESTHVPARTDGTLLLGPEYREALFERIDTELADMREDRLSVLVAEHIDPAGERDGGPVDVARAALREAVDHLFVGPLNATSHAWPNDVVEQTSRDGAPTLMTGGMSWGDDPTESFRHFTVLNALAPFQAPFTSSVDEAPTLTVRVVEQVSWTVHVPLTAELLDEAEQAGHSRDARGVADLFDEDTDHQEVIDRIDPLAPDSVEEREVYVEDDTMTEAQAALDARD